MVKRAVLVAVLLCMFSGAAFAGGLEPGPDGVVQSIQIKATAKEVFSALRQYRNSPVDCRKLVKAEGSKAIIDEEVCKLPIIGQLHNRWEEDEQGTDRIDYHLIESDKFKSGSGSYVISEPNADGAVTLSLSIQIDTGIHFPGSKLIEKRCCRKDVRTRLEYIKNLAERQHDKH